MNLETLNENDYPGAILPLESKIDTSNTSEILLTEKKEIESYDNDTKQTAQQTYNEVNYYQLDFLGFLPNLYKIIISSIVIILLCYLVFRNFK